MRLDHISEKEKRDIIINRLDQNMFVEAGAGAGKTTIMVSRIIHQLMGGIRPGEIVAITFTNAATRELKGRIFQKAFKIARSEQDGYTQQEIANLTAALDELDQMQISTIHSFCYRLLSEKMLDAKLPFGFTLAEEEDVAADRERYFKRWAEGLQREDWEKLLPTGKYRSGVLDRIRNLANQLDPLPGDYTVKVALPDLSETDARAVLQPIQNKVMQDALKVVNDVRRTRYTSFLDVDDDFLSSYGKKLKEVLATDDFTAICRKLIGLPDTAGFITKKITVAEMKAMGIDDKKDQKSHASEAVEKDNDIRDYLAFNGDLLERTLAGYQNTFYRPYIAYAEDAVRYRREQRAEGVLSNDRLLQKTWELVTSSEESRRFFARKYKAIYVDEFQDTDHLQESFIRLLSADPDDPDRLRDGALFVVGDPKQSIYRFRGAEPDVYFEAKGRMEALDNALVVELCDNYRSNERIIDWVNAKFSGLNITEGHSYIPMNPVKTLPAAGLPEALLAGVYRYKSPTEPISKDYLKGDAVALCELIQSLVKNGYLIADRDEKDQVFYREIRYSDFLILCMNTPGMDVYVEGFHQYGIPVILDSKKNVSGDQQLLSFIRLYAYISDPYDRGAFVGALEALHETGSSDRALNEGILQDLLEDTRDMSAFGCLKALSLRPELFLHKDTGIEDYQLQDMQTKITQMMEQVGTLTYGNRGEILEGLIRYTENKVEHELLPKKDINAIRFMNLHKAKGLEGNIVIWTNRTENKAFKDGAYRNGKEFYPSVGYQGGGFTVTEWTAYGGEKSLIIQAKAEDESENIRLEYVAATRAKQALIFMDRYNKAAGNMFSEHFDLAELPSVEEIVKKYSEDTEEKTYAQIAPTANEQRRLDRRQFDRLGAPVFSSESPSDYEVESAGLAGKSAVGDGSHVRPKGNVFGTVMHRAFELVVDRWNCKPKLLQIDPSVLIPSCVRQAVNESIEEIREDETALYESFLTNAVMAFGTWFSQEEIKKNAKRMYTELPFSFMKNGDASGDPVVWMHGEADLVIEENDGSYVIVDYKSDDDERYVDEAAFEERLRGKYSPQIGAYKEAVRHVFALRDDVPVRMLLVSFSMKNVEKNQKLRIRITEL